MAVPISDALILQMAYERSKIWTEFLSETIAKKDEIVIKASELDSIVDNDKSSSSSLSSMETEDTQDEAVEPENVTNNATKGSTDSITKENADWSVEEAVDVQEILNRTRCVLVESGMERVLDSFDLEEIEDKVGSWLRENVSFQSSEVISTHSYISPQMNCNRLEPVPKGYDSDSDSDSFNSGDTARYILTNRTRHKCYPLQKNKAIKNFCLMKSRRDALRQKYAFLNDDEEFKCQQTHTHIQRQLHKFSSYDRYKYDHENLCQHNFCCRKSACKCQFDLAPIAESPVAHNREKIKSCLQHCDSSNVKLHYKHVHRECDTFTQCKTTYNTNSTAELARSYPYKCNFERELKKYSEKEHFQLSPLHWRRNNCICDKNYMCKTNRKLATPLSESWFKKIDKIPKDDFQELKHKDHADYASDCKVSKKKTSKSEIEVNFKTEYSYKDMESKITKNGTNNGKFDMICISDSDQEKIIEVSKKTTRKRKPVTTSNKKKQQKKDKNTEELKKLYKLESLSNSEEELELAIKLSKQTHKEERKKRLKDKLRKSPRIKSLEEECSSKNPDNTFFNNIKKAVNSTAVQSKNICESDQEKMLETTEAFVNTQGISDNDCAMVTSTSDHVLEKRIINSKINSEKILIYSPTDLSLVPQNSLASDNFTLTKEHLSTMIGVKMATKFFKYYIGSTQFNKNCTVYYIPPTELDGTTLFESDDSECDLIECQGMFGKLHVT